MPVGFLITAGLLAAGMAMSLWPPARSGRLGLVTWFFSAIVNESPFLAFYWLVISALLAISPRHSHGPQMWVALGLSAVPFAGTPVLVRRSLRAAPAIEQALERGLGPNWRQVAAVRSVSPNPPWARILLAPIPLLHLGVKRVWNLSYGDAGRRNRLDLYRRRGGRGSGPMRIHLHGGGFLRRPRAQELLRAAAAVRSRPPGLGPHPRHLPTWRPAQLVDDGLPGSRRAHRANSTRPA